MNLGSPMIPAQYSRAAGSLHLTPPDNIIAYPVLMDAAGPLRAIKLP